MNSTHAFVFPGQGSQSVGMLAALADHYPIVRSTFDDVSARLGEDVWALVSSGPAEKLNQTMNTQVAMLTADVAVYRVLEQEGVKKARMMAGHSLGEYAALVCSGAIALPDAAMLVRRRGQLMQETVPLGVGAMAAIVGLTDAQVQQVCEQACSENENVTPANYNAIGQVVIAGHTEAVLRAMHLAEDLGARLAKQLPVSVPCHCLLLKEAAELFEDALQSTSFQIPALPVMSNVDLSFYQTTSQIRQLLKEQLYRPVRWVETLQKMKQEGVTLVIESGPGQVLSGLVKRVDASMEAMSVYDPERVTNLFAKHETLRHFERIEP